MPRLDGVDVSTWNGAIDAAGAKAAGLKFVAVQVGWTARADAQGNPRLQNRMVADSWYRRNVDACRAAGLRVIHYYVPVNRPWPEQMAAFAKITGPIPPSEGEMFDLEYEQAKAMGSVACRQWMDACELRSGNRVAHYGELFDQWDPGRPKWVAHYGSNPATEAQRADMERRYAASNAHAVWQYTSKLRLPYVGDGQVDTDGNEILDRRLFDELFSGGESLMDNGERDVTQDPGWVEDPDWVDELMAWLRAVEADG